MKHIKFKNTNANEQSFTKEVKEQVHSYFREHNTSIRGNIALHLKTIIMLIIYLAPFILITILPMLPYLAIILVIVMGIGKAGIGMSVMHDGAHNSYSEKLWLNKFASGTIYLFGSTPLAWKIQHNILHHTYTNIFELDRDISTNGVIRLCDREPLKSYHRYQHIYSFPLYGLMTLSRFFGEIGSLLEYNKMGITKSQNHHPIREVIKLISTKIVYLLVIIGLPLVFTEFSVWQLLFGFATMHVVAGTIMGVIFQLAHVVEGAAQPLADSNKAIPTNWFVHQLNTTSNFGRKNGLLSWYIGGLDFQIEHHLFQNISHIHYPLIAPIVESTAKKYGFEYNLKPSIFHALTSHYRRLKELGKG